MLIFIASSIIIFLQKNLFSKLGRFEKKFFKDLDDLLKYSKFRYKDFQM